MTENVSLKVIPLFDKEGINVLKKMFRFITISDFVQILAVCIVPNTDPSHLNL